MLHEVAAPFSSPHWLHSKAG